MKLFAVVTFVCGLAGCQFGVVPGSSTVPPSTVPAVDVAVGQPPVVPVVVPAVVLVSEGGYVPDMVSGQRLDVLMAPDGGEDARCDDMGGTLVGFICEGVDF